MSGGGDSTQVPYVWGGGSRYSVVQCIMGNGHMGFPPVNRQMPVKTLPSIASFADGKKIRLTFNVKLLMTPHRWDYDVQASKQGHTNSVQVSSSYEEIFLISEKL